MNSNLMLILPILIPIICGGSMAFINFDDERKRNIYVFYIVLITSFFAFAVNFWGPEEGITFVGFGSKMAIAFKVDGLGRLFSSMVAILWPLATVYAFEYMEHEGNEKRFYAFYTVTYGVTLAISYAANFLTMYLFYEMLTLVTLPLVIHTMNQQAFSAGRKYISYSIGGATAVFICLVFIASFGETLDFHLGGVFAAGIMADHGGLLLQVFTLGFIGLSVKAAMFPFHGWLPSATVAPTTVTALLHAVAVVKAGAFATMRLTYYIFGTELLWGTWAQQAVMALTLITILYGSARAWYTSHFKRRLAYSTVSQLSYILFGVTLMTPEGMAAAMIYMVAHGFIKILLFYCCGAVNIMAHRYDVRELEGLGRHMPVTFAAFTIGALSLMGLPPTAGFVAKLQLLTALAQGGDALALGGIAVFILSMLLTAAYLFDVIRAAYFPKTPESFLEGELIPKDPGASMTIPLKVLAFMAILIGVASRPLLEWITLVSQGLR